MDLKVRCACGTVQGTIKDVSPGSVNVTICECKWCRWYLQALDRSEHLDEHGGTTVMITSPARLTFTAGQDQIACGRMTSKGPRRWYAGCCKTPLANTIRPTIPFMAVQSAAIDHESLADVAGPVRARINSALTGEQARAHKATPGAQRLMMLRLGGLLSAWWLQGAHKEMPFPKVEARRFERPEDTPE